MTKNFIGKLFGDKGYISKKLAELLAMNDVELITKLKKNMKPKIIALFDKILLRKRSIIETIIAALARTRYTALLNKSNFGQNSSFVMLVRFLRTQACPDLSFC